MKRSRAFSLVELLVAVALACTISVSLFYFSNLSVKLISATYANAKHIQIVRYVSSRIFRDIAESNGAATGSSSSVLIINNISYELLDKKVRRKEDAYVSNLTDTGEIISMKFFYPSSKFIGIEIIPKIGEVYYFNAYARQ